MIKFSLVRQKTKNYYPHDENVIIENVIIENVNIEKKSKYRKNYFEFWYDFDMCFLYGILIQYNEKSLFYPNFDMFEIFDSICTSLVYRAIFLTQIMLTILTEKTFYV